MRRLVGWLAGIAAIALAGGAAAEAPPVHCKLGTGAAPRDLIEACTADLATWPISDRTFRAAMLAARGDAWSSLDEATAARRDLDEAVELNPASAQLWALRGRVRLLARDLDGARQDLDEALRLEPDFPSVLIIRGELALMQGRPAEAEADARAALALSSRMPEPWGVLAKARLARGEPEKALAEINSGLALAPDNEQLLALRMAVYAQLGRFEDVATDATASLRADPGDPVALLWRARTSLQAGDLEGAERDLDAVVAALPGQPAAYGLRAFVFMARGNSEAAVRDAGTMVRLDPQSGLLVRAQIYAALERDAEALADYDAAIASRPMATTYLLRSGMRPASDRALQIDDLTKALALEPDRSDVRGARALSYSRARRFEEALADAAVALAGDPEDLDALNARVNVYRALDDDLRLIETLDRLMPLALPHASLFNARCWALATSGGDLKRALSDCEEAVRLAPTVAGYRDSLGMTHLQAGRWTEAIAAYDGALKIKPDLPESLFGRGIARRRSGDLVGGDADLAAARTLNAGIDKTFAAYRLVP